MAGASGPTPADVRAMLRLSHALHTCSDGVARKKQLLAGLCHLLEADSGLDMVSHIQRFARRQTIISATRHGSIGRLEELLPLRCATVIDRTSPEFRNAGSGPQWHHIAWPARPSRSGRLIHCLWRPAPTSDDLIIAALCLKRNRATRPPFVARERMLLHVAHMEMSWVYQADLLMANHGVASLSPRQKETLGHLLHGCSEKQIADKMHLSPNTVHHHIKALHRHFGVSSRSELLARWLR